MKCSSLVSRNPSPKNLKSATHVGNSGIREFRFKRNFVEPTGIHKTLREFPKTRGGCGVYAEAMWIMVSHPYRSTSRDPAVWEANRLAMNRIALQVWERGHMPVLGVNAALPLIEAAGEGRYEEIMMPLALSLLERCDAVLYMGYSKGAQMEADRARELGLPVYTSLDELPPGHARDSADVA